MDKINKIVLVNKTRRGPVT